MITTSDIKAAVDWIEEHPVIGTAILTSLGYTIIGISKSVIKWLRKNSVYVKPTFWTFGKKYKITAVHKYIPSNDASGYAQHQHSRPDQWCKLIRIDSKFFNLRHTIVPIEPSDVLAVIISRDGNETERVVNFNR